MFIRYVIEMKSWIAFFLAALFFTDLLIWLDNGFAVPFESILYLNVLLLIGFIIFFVWRYKKEMRFVSILAELTEDMDSDWFESLSEPLSYRDMAAFAVLREANQYSKRQLSAITDAHVMEQDYMSSWVHEVKAPLTAMKLTIDANRHHPEVRKIEAGWLRIHLLVDRQLYISRLPSLESDYILEPQPLLRLAAQEVRELASWCVEKNIAVEIDGEDTPVVTDSKWCRFIIRQLLTNAVKYSPMGSSIQLVTSIAPSGNVVLIVKDEGPGIPAHDLPRIFDKGFTGGAGRIQNAATGLGLYLAKIVAGKIGIVLEAFSDSKHGTTMQMTFSAKNPFESIRT
ncbi:integral membrane sensor signal transduction histidine kinase [Paenibacillus alvei TS-15]|uniref:histidine kinase n=1 Tax=Paenibacillus alvei TS-15 TaxID=1117108 RepID=S9SG14_PAEAL|nr:sensor histidine kinase [Paenibacillus alvei]EPY03684.1 integral membrane sensor signal transduction histidine kinase [Paenibacillus alvei TS-15]